MGGYGVLLGLLLLAFIGNALLGASRSTRAVGLASGVEFVVLGFVLGPHALGALSRDTVAGFEPVLVVALGWAAFGMGLEWGTSHGRRTGVPGALLGFVTTGVVMAGVGGTVHYATGRLGGYSERERWILAAALSVCLSATGGQGIRRLAERSSASGPITRLVEDITEGGVLLPVLGLGALFVYGPTRVDAAGALPSWVLLGVTVAIGLVMALITAVLVEKELPGGQVWGLLMGTSLLAVGTALRLDLATVTTAFLMGVTVRLVSRAAPAVSAIVAPTSQALVVPALVLMGGMIDLRGSGAAEGIVLGAALATRVLLKGLSGAALAVGPARGAGPAFGVALTPAGTLAVLCGVSVAVEFPGKMGSLVLTVSTASLLLGELIGFSSLRTLLKRAGEIPEPMPAFGGTPTPPKAEALATPVVRGEVP